MTEAGANHDEREIDAVVEVLRTTTLDIGERVERFEGAIAELLAKQHGVMVNSGTSAIRLAVDLIGCEPGDEVITPVVTFSSDVAPLVQSGIVPAFVDVEPDTFQNCPDWDRIREIADRHASPRAWCGPETSSDSPASPASSTAHQPMGSRMPTG